MNVTLTIDDTTVDTTLNQTMAQRINKMMNKVFPTIASVNTNKDAIRIVCEKYLSDLLADYEGNQAGGDMTALLARYQQQASDRQAAYAAAYSKAETDATTYLT